MELETRGWRGIVCYEWPAPPSGTTERTRHELPLRTMSESVARVGVFVCDSYYLPLKNMRMSLVSVATGNQGLCITGPTPHWLLQSGELAPPPTAAIL